MVGHHGLLRQRHHQIAVGNGVHVPWPGLAHQGELGLLIGLATGLCRLSSNPTLRDLSTIYVELVRGTPLLVQIFIFYFFIGTVMNLSREFAGIAALLFATQLKVIQSTVPPNLELTVITAAVVGGVSILGGVGTVVGSTLAAVLIAEIASALVFINVSPYWIHAVQGVLILVTVVADILRRRRRLAGG